MPLRLRFKYAQVYEKNVDRIGMLKEPLLEQLSQRGKEIITLIDQVTMD